MKTFFCFAAGAVLANVGFAVVGLGLVALAAAEVVYQMTKLEAK